MSENEIEKIEPIVITDNATGFAYTLEFSRKSVMWAERNGFKVSGLEDMGSLPMTTISDLFYYAFGMHHKGISRDKTDDILFNKLGGVSTALVERLVNLYLKPYNAFIIDDENEDNSKNSTMTVQL